MAWTEQCKIDAVAQVDHLVQRDGIGKRQALRQMAKESGIPYGTLRRWYYPVSVPKNGNARTKPKAKIISVNGFKTKKWKDARAVLKQANTILEKLNGSSLDSLQCVSIEALRGFLKEFNQLVQYAGAAQEKVNIHTEGRKAA